jgi:hypothetical protein
MARDCTEIRVHLSNLDGYNLSNPELLYNSWGERMALGRATIYLSWELG